MIVPVILSGGSGTRLWPLSTPERPKQFLPLTGPDSLFRQTVARVSDQSRYTPSIVVANAAHEALCREELAGYNGWQIILEPIARNTAAAIVMAAEVARTRHGPDAVILVMPSDHRIGDCDAFHSAVQTGLAAARDGRLVTFGIQPTGPEIGFGYLEAGAPIGHAGDVFSVARFTEKPDKEAARQMLATGGYYWNGGIFLYSAQSFLAEAERFAPEVYGPAIAAVREAQGDSERVTPSRRALEQSADISVDYAVMERSDRVAMVPLSADWSDVGSWDAVAELPQRGATGVRLVESPNCFVSAQGLQVSLLGVEDLIVVATGDQVVVIRRGETQRIKELAAQAAAH